MDVSTEKIKELRGKSGAGIMDCRQALITSEGDMDKALELLKEKGLTIAKKKAERTTEQGIIAAYVHNTGRIGAMVELDCETDFVARTDEFKELSRCLAMQVAALSPQYVSKEDLPQGSDLDPKEVCLLAQPFIKDPAKTVNDMVIEAIAKVGENIRVKRFTRFEIGA